MLKFLLFLLLIASSSYAVFDVRNGIWLGWQHIEKMISNGDLKIGKWLNDSMPKWYRMAEEYYSQTKDNKRYWYYFIPDRNDISEAEILEAINLSMKQ